jgi:MFS family permease
MMASAKLDLVGATSLVSMIFIGSALSSPLLGWLSGFKKPSSLMLASAFATAVLMVLVIYGPKTSLPVLFLLFFFLGFACSVYQLPFAVVNHAVPTHVTGVAMGVTNIICMLSGPILQPVIGFFLAYNNNHLGAGFEAYPIESFQTSLLILPICLVLAIFLALKLRSGAKGERRGVHSRRNKAAA